MAFENLGIGGVLRFEARAAVSNMGAAERAFKGVETRANQLSTSVSRIGSGLQRLNIGGNILSLAGGLSLAGLVREGINFNKEMETAKIAIATVMAATTKTPLQENIEGAATAMDRLNVISAQTPGEIMDLVGIYQMMAGPITAAGGEMEDILELSKGTAIMAGVLKRSFADTGATMAKMQAGSAEAGNDIIIMLRSMGLLTETTAEWREMLPEQRLKRIKEIMGTFAESGEMVGQTFDAQSSTIKSLGKIILGAFTETLFKRITQTLGGMAKSFYDNEKAVLATARAWGEKFGAAVEFVGEAVVETGRFMVDMFSLARHWIQKGTDALDRFGLAIDMQVLGKLTFIATTFVAISAAISPLLSLVGLFAGKIAAIGSILSGLVGVIAAIAVPLLIVAGIIAGIFLLFRMEGESIGDTLARAADAGLELWARLKAVVLPIVDYLLQAFENIKNTGAKFWEGIQPGLANLRLAIVGIINLIFTIVDMLVPIIGKIIVGITKVIEALRPGLTIIFNLVARIVRVIVDALSVIVPKVIAILGPIIDVLLKIAVKLGEVFSKIWQFLEPVISAIVTVFETVVVPVLGWVLDTFGPVLVAAFEAIGFVIGIVLDALMLLMDALTFIVEVAMVPFQLAWEGLKWLWEQIGGVINDYIIEPIKTAIGLVSDVIGLIGDAVSAIGDFLGDVGSFVGDVAGSVAGGMSDAAGAVGDFLGITDSYEAVLIDAAMLTEQSWNNATGAVNGTADAAADATAQVALMSEEMAAWNGYFMAMANLAKVQKIVDQAVIDAKMQPEINLKNDIKVKSNLCIDGRNMSAATARHQIETQERAGFNNTPWQNRRVQISGVGGNK